MMKNIRIVLINTSHPGNIGATARAMKTMGLNELYLVQPLNFPHPKAHEMASNAGDVVDQAIVVDSLEAAIGDARLVVGTSTRSRTIPWPMLTPREFAEKARVETLHSKVAILFGREQSGLTNEELHRCHFHIQIPSNPEYSSLNLAAAVQVIAYEICVASQNEVVTPQSVDWDYQWANAEQMEGFYEHLQRVLVALDFLKPEAPRQLMTRLRRLFHRARPDVMELNILRGILGAVEKNKK
ncbi:MAG: tRNA (cytosine(32)/uridine(32)-2'-O)-methyltransferase TrmJ [Gammaproteobacteria bacterium]|nr:tRNA (cytosine(32)/uridine(32)-2'-O)-methyltransferase TrmJ [Gammaproteobacteria bacterium]